ncbi:MAG: hypothetical protein IJ313_08315, partial [Clostridia bacterium]|nr:hypothetical protein [Clostridia bacterium]
MREQCFLTAAVQNMKRLVKAFYSIPPSVCMLKAHVLNLKTWALLMVCTGRHDRLPVVFEKSLTPIRSA